MQKKKNKKQKVGSYKRYFLAAGLIISMSGLITVVSSQSIRAQISTLYNRQNDQVAGVTALMSAVVSHDIEGVRFFSKAGKNLINQKNLGGATALHLAGRNKDFEVAKILVDNGADVNILDNEAWSPLMRAALAGDVDTVNLLLDHGANASYLNSAAESALYHAALANCDDCLVAMMNKFDFTRDSNLEITKKQISDAFIVATNHDDKAAQSILNSLLDMVNKASVVNDSKVINFNIDNKKSKKFNVKNIEKAHKKLPKNKDKPDVKITDEIKVEEPVKPKAEVRPEEPIKPKVENAIEQNPAPVYNKGTAAPKFKFAKPQEKIENAKKLPESENYVPLNQGAESQENQASKAKVFIFMQEASGAKKNTVNVAQ